MVQRKMFFFIAFLPLDRSLFGGATVASAKAMEVVVKHLSIHLNFNYISFFFSQHLPNFFCNQSSGIAQYVPVGSTAPRVSVVSRLPNRNLHFVDANSPGIIQINVSNASQLNDSISSVRKLSWLQSMTKRH